MEFNFLLLVALAALLIAVGLVAMRGLVHGRIRRFLVLGLVGVSAALLFRTYLGASTRSLLEANAGYPLKNPTQGYVSSEQCKACHPREYATWHASFHRTMTQRPTSESVEGIFNVALRRGDEEFDLIEDGGHYRVGMPRPAWWNGPAQDGRIERPVELMTGSHNYQVYWVSTGNSRVLSQVPYVYLVAEKLWVPRRSVFMIPPNEVLGSEYGRWNTTCIQCHTTFGRPNVDPRNTDVAFSEVGEFGIACEACHGPAGEHAQLMSNPLRRYAAHLGMTPAPAITNPKKLSAERSTQVCGQCHSVHVARDEEFQRWLREGFSFHPGDDLNQTRDIVKGDEARNDPEHFWPDGDTRVTGREFNGVVESPCFASGKFSCLSCHEPHKQEDDARSLAQWRVGLLKPFEEKNDVCLQCHEKFAADSALASHTHHAPTGSGSQCVNCHMPHTVYGLGRTERSHRISSPSVATELATGRPNACNLCHIDRTLAWAGEHLSQWYGAQAPALSNEQQHVAASLLWLYRGDAHQRALAMWALGWPSAREVAGSDWVVPHLDRAIGDPYQVLGLVAWRSLRKVFGDDAVPGRILMREPAARVEAANAAFGAKPAAKIGRELLLDEGGALDEPSIAKLLAERDNRPVRLSE